MFSNRVEAEMFLEVDDITQVGVCQENLALYLNTILLFFRSFFQYDYKWFNEKNFD
jgi:hypothetical protein